MKHIFSNLAIISATTLDTALVSCSDLKPRAGVTQQSAALGQHEKRGMPQSIGTATMASNGTIILDLRAEGQGGTLGDARLVYPHTDRQYADILKHLGGLRPGETKEVPPWP